MAMHKSKEVNRSSLLSCSQGVRFYISDMNLPAATGRGIYLSIYHPGLPMPDVWVSGIFPGKDFRRISLAGMTANNKAEASFGELDQMKLIFQKNS
jgi:hypothetical protein